MVAFAKQYDADGTTLVAGYDYDGLNRRVVKEKYAAGSLTEMRHYYYSDQWQVLEERVQQNYGSSGSASAPESLYPERQFVWGLRYVNDLVLRDRDTDTNGSLDERLYALQDPNWNVVAIANTSGAIQERYCYDAYGKPTILTPTFTTRGTSSYAWTYLYTGRELDLETGLYDYRNRIYHPFLGRFITKDPIGYSTGDASLYRYVFNNPVMFVDPMGLIDVTKHGPHYGAGSPLPTSKANTIATNYKFSNWLITDLGGMVQRVSDEGTFSFSGNGVEGTWSWKETYDEGWVRGVRNKKYSFTDFHNAGPKQAAKAVEKFFGRTFTRKADNNTLYLGEWEICSWEFTMKATFDMRNAWRNDWVALNLDKVTFGGAGNHTWETSLATSVVGGGGGIAWFESNENNGALYGFAKFLYPNKGVAPPVGQWEFGTFHAISHESWSESWQSGQAKPTMKYEGGYEAAQ